MRLHDALKHHQIHLDVVTRSVYSISLTPLSSLSAFTSNGPLVHAFVLSTIFINDSMCVRMASIYAFTFLSQASRSFSPCIHSSAISSSRLQQSFMSCAIISCKALTLSSVPISLQVCIASLTELSFTRTLV